MEFKTMETEALIERKKSISIESEAEGADLDALEAEIRAINEELEARRAEEAKKAEIRNAVAEGEGEVIKTFENMEEKREMFTVDSIEYRDAWTKSICKLPMNEEERAALTSAGAVIPTTTVNAVWDKLVADAPLLAKVDLTRFRTYVRFPVATTNNAATSQAVGGTISESSDVIGYVDLIPNEYVKLLTVGTDIENMAISAIHDWIVDNLAGQISAKINADILTGNGTNKCKGITATVSASATAIPATVTKASILKIMGALASQHQAGAIWIMTPTMFYENIMPLTDLNDYIINDGFDFRLFGHEVILMSEALVSSKETIFYGNPKAYKCNIFKEIEIKPFETATTTNIQWRGATLADGELIDATAFVRFAQA